MKKFLSLLLAIALTFSFLSCGSEDATGSDSSSESGSETTENLSTETLGVERLEKFGSVYIKSTIEDFLALGFEYGDAVDVVFDNGYSMKHIPFYSGYYTKPGNALLVAYQGYPYIALAPNNGPDIWLEGNMNESTTAVITLNEKGAFKAVQDSLNLIYSNDRDDFASDEIFANFRSLKGGNMKEDFLFRSASPCNNSYNRAPFVNALVEQNKIGYILDLADNEEELEKYLKDDTLKIDFWKKLYQEKKIFPMNMSADYSSEAYANAVRDAARKILSEDGPFLFHCTEGKDRTGFVCLLFEALCGATYEEVLQDYMITYDNYFSLTKESNQESYDAVIDVRFSPIIEFLCETRDPSSVSAEDLHTGAKRYLSRTGMSDAEIEEVIAKISK